MYVCICTYSEVKVAQSCTTFCDSMYDTVHGILQARILEWVLSLLQGIFPTQGSKPGLSHCRQILYQLSHQENPCVYMVRTVGHTPARPLPCCPTVPTGTTSRVPRTSWSPPASPVRGMQQLRPAQKRTSSTDSSC